MLYKFQKMGTFLVLIDPNEGDTVLTEEKYLFFIQRLFKT
jgi:hypothetical protein